MPDQHATPSHLAGSTTAGANHRAADAATSPDQAAPETDSARIAELEAACKESEDRWRRALADADNLRKRFERELQRLRADERARLATEWLPIVDNLEMALEHPGADNAALLEGVRAVHDQAVAVLARLGFDRLDEAGVPFDPARHEATATVSDQSVSPGTVVRVIRPGYGRAERQLRPASVVVATEET
jgi:molecular chaperone GrpE